MSAIPNDILLIRAISAFERAQLELAQAGPLGAQDAADWIEKGIRLVQEALGA